jgi:putative hydrolase of the HAD superfamily
MEVVDQARQIDYRERTTSSTVCHVLDEMGFTGVEDAVVEAAIQRMFAVSEAWWHPMPGVRKVMETLQRRGHRLGLISNAGDAANARRLLRKTGVGDYLQPILISSEVGWRKPHEEIFLQVLRAWSVRADEVVMVGDTLEEDILGAKKAGMRQIWLRGDGRLEERHEEIAPDVIADALAHVPALVEALGSEITAG